MKGMEKVSEREKWHFRAKEASQLPHFHNNSNKTFNLTLKDTVKKIHPRSTYNLQLILISVSSEESIKQGQWRAEGQRRGKVRENRKQTNKK